MSAVRADAAGDGGRSLEGVIAGTVLCPTRGREAERPGGRRGVGRAGDMVKLAVRDHFGFGLENGLQESRMTRFGACKILDPSS